MGLEVSFPDPDPDPDPDPEPSFESESDVVSGSGCELPVAPTVPIADEPLPPSPCTGLPTPVSPKPPETPKLVA